MKQKIKNAFETAKRIVCAVADDYGMTDFRSRIVTLEDEHEQPFAEMLVVFKNKALKQVQIQENGKTWTRNVESEEEAVNDIYGIITEIGSIAKNLVWLGE